MFFRIALSVLFCSIALAAGSESYDGFKIYDINAKNEFEKEVLYRLESNENYDFFILPKIIGQAARVMVKPEDQVKFETTLNQLAIDFSVVNENVGNSVELERKQNSFLRTVLDESSSSISFSKFHRYDDIVNYLNILAQSNPRRVFVKTIGKTYEKRELKAIFITDGDHRRDKKIILVDAGIDAREWIAPASALYVIKELVENFPANQNLLKDYLWIVIPVANPDGYEYTHTKSRMWRKTRKPSNAYCFGVDANSNFDFHWGEIGASNNSCHNNFKGETAFSEPETQALSELMLSLIGKVKMYLTMHANGNSLSYPYGYTSVLPYTWKDMNKVARAGASAIFAATRTKYRVGSSASVSYPAAGSSSDYAFGVAEIPVAITMNLPSGDNGFDPEPSQIETIVKETWIGIKAMAEEVISKY